MVHPFTTIQQVSVTVQRPDGTPVTLLNDPHELVPCVDWIHDYSDILRGTYTIHLHTVALNACTCDVTETFQVKCKPQFFLDRNYVIPTDPRVEVMFRLTEDSHVKIDIYNLAGELIKSGFVDDYYPAGRHHPKSWNLTNDDGEPVASGVYVFAMESGSIDGFRKVAVIR